MYPFLPDFFHSVLCLGDPGKVFVGLYFISFSLLYSVPWSEYTIIDIFILLLIDFKFFITWVIKNETVVIHFVPIFGA